MTDRDRLIQKLADELHFCNKSDCVNCLHCKYDLIADFIIKEGYIRPPCKVGDTVYKITHLCGGETIIVKGTVIEITMTEKSLKSKKVDCRFYFWADGEEITRRMHSLWCWWFDIGETVFLTKEGAEEKLKELGK